MPYLIDTTWVIDHLAGIPDATRLLAQLADEGIAISIVTYMEAFQGIERDPDPKTGQSKLDRFLDEAPIVPFTPAVARRCARLRETLGKQGKRVRGRALDLIIAATALEYDLTLVTRNSKDYEDISGLEVSPWT